MFYMILNMLAYKIVHRGIAPKLLAPGDATNSESTEGLRPLPSSKAVS